MIFFLAVIEYAILASTFTIGKVAVAFADPLFLIGVRMAVAAPLMFIVHKFQKNARFYIKPGDWPKIFKTGFFHIFLPFIGEFWAFQYVSSAKTAIIYSLTPFVAAILSYFLLAQKISKTQVLGLSIGMLGLLPIFLTGDQVSHGAGEFLHVSLPELVLLTSVASASYGWFLVSDLMKKGYGISLVNGFAMLVGGVLSLGLWLIVSSHENPLRGELSDFIFWMLMLVLVANVISYNFYGWLLKHLSITLMSAIGFLCPIFASIYGVILLDEKLGFNHAAALLLVCCGLWLFYKDETKIISHKK